ncbi:hypothetical protein GCM10028818_03330 [Spirosoma horti]
MTTLLTSCPYDQLTLEGLSANQLVAKQAKNRQVGRFMLLLLVLIVGMAFILDSYLVAVTSWAMIPALNDYNKKRKAINKHMQKRSIG